MVDKFTEDQIAKIRSKFDAIDENGDGFITKDELKKMLKDSLGEESATDEQVDLMMSNLDINQDGKVDFEEYLKG